MRAGDKVVTITRTRDRATGECVYTGETGVVREIITDPLDEYDVHVKLDDGRDWFFRRSELRQIGE